MNELYTRERHSCLLSPPSPSYRSRPLVTNLAAASDHQLTAQQMPTAQLLTTNNSSCCISRANVCSCSNRKTVSVVERTYNTHRSVQTLTIVTGMRSTNSLSDMTFCSNINKEIRFSLFSYSYM